MPKMLSPTKVHRTYTTQRELYVKLVQKTERLGITPNDAINLLLLKYCGEEKLSEEKQKWVDDSLEKILKERGMTKARVGQRGLGKKTLEKIKGMR